MLLRGGENEGFQLLEEFRCEAIPCDDLTGITFATRYAHDEVQIVGDESDQAIPHRLTDAEKSDLAKLSSRQLLDFVRATKSLSLDGWKFLVTLAVERVDAKEPKLVSGAKELLQAEICL